MPAESKPNSSKSNCLLAALLVGMIFGLAESLELMTRDPSIVEIWLSGAKLCLLLSFGYFLALFVPAIIWAMVVRRSSAAFFFVSAAALLIFRAFLLLGPVRSTGGLERVTRVGLAGATVTLMVAGLLFARLLRKRRGWVMLIITAVVWILFALGVPAFLSDQQMVADVFSPERDWKDSRSGPNLLVISVDTLRADHTGAYGYPLPTTPCMDRLAREGTLFADAVAPAPLTLPSHTSLFTGKYPPSHGVRDNGRYRVQDEQTTLAERLAQEGYRNGAFVSAFVLDRRFGLNQGFETYDDRPEPGGSWNIYLSVRARGRCLLIQASRKLGLRFVARFFEARTPRRNAALTVNAAIKWTKFNFGRSFFLWVHLFDPHGPIDIPPQFGRLFRNEVRVRESSEAPPNYDGAVRFADYWVEKLVASLISRGLLKDTLILFVSDHGEHLGEHDYVGHTDRLYEPSLRSPVVAWKPGLLPANRMIPETVSLVDLYPAVLEWLGFGFAGPSKKETAGSSSKIARLLDDNRDPILEAEDPGIYSETFHSNRSGFALRSLRLPRFKLIELAGTGELQLFDLYADPLETQSLAETNSDLARRLATMLSGFGPAPDDGEGRKLTTDEQERLRALGYLQ